MKTTPTNLWKFGISESHTKLHNNRHYVSVPYISEFLTIDPTMVRSMAKSICLSHGMDPSKEIKKLNEESYREVDFLSEELVYLLFMSRDRDPITIKLRKTFAQILWSSDHSMTLPFPPNNIEDVQNKIIELKSSLDFLSSELQKSIQYSQRTIVE